jgi:pyruvate,orthophosphate dikinase
MDAADRRRFLRLNPSGVKNNLDARGDASQDAAQDNPGIAGRMRNVPGGETGDDAVPTFGIPVYCLDHAPALAAAELRQLLGGKGAGLVEMRKLGVPVPPGFVLATSLCSDVLAAGWPAGLDQAIDAQLARLEAATGQRLGDGGQPLLVSVRSGAPVSMPGMMDTILNLGANERTIAALAARSGDERFAYDTWSRFSRMYAVTVLGIAAEALAPIPSADASIATLHADIVWLRDICARRGTPIPDDPRQQLRGAVEAVFRSCRTQRARVFREREGLALEMPTAVVVQAMVFGNMGPLSGTGVAFSRNPSTGKNEPYGDFLATAQGEDVVAGRRASAPLAAMRTRMPAAFDALCRIMRTLEQHYRDLCDVEFTVQDGALHVLQVRAGKRSAIAAARIAVDMAGEGLITRDAAVRRLSREQVRQLQVSCVVRDGSVAIAHGVAASPGVVSGVVCLHPDRVAAMAQGAQSVILVRPTTSPADVHGMVKSVGIVTATGGMVSHAALVARGWGIAAVCGVSALTFDPPCLAGVALREGEHLTIDGGNGAVYRGDCAVAGAAAPRELATLRAWAAELGRELGEQGAADAPVAAESCTVDAFAVARALALLGFAAEERIATALVTSAEAVRQALALLPANHLNRTPRGLQLAPEGRTWLQAQLDAERACTDRAAAERLYGDFLTLDDRFKHLVSSWQMRNVDGRDVLNDHADAAYDANVRARLAAFHGDAAPLIEAICACAPRLTPYRTRFVRAARAIASGDGSMIASPLKDSYHTIWFELHEELIHLSGRSRAVEEATAGSRGVA